MTKESFRARYHNEMAHVHVSAQLRRKTLDLLEGKEKPVMKKKLSFAVVFLIILLLCAVALATATRFGVLDFAGRGYNLYMPEDAQQYIQSDVLHLENELVMVDVREIYYDGLTSRMVVDVKPQDDKTMLLGMDMSADDNWQMMLRFGHEWDDGDSRTVRDLYAQGGYESAWAVETVLEPMGEKSNGGSYDYHLNDDGTLTIYMQDFFEHSAAQRETKLIACLIPCDPSSDSLEEKNLDGQIRLSHPLTLEEVSYDSQVYQGEGAYAYPSLGVRVDRLRLEVKAQDIYATIDFTVTDPELYATVGDGLWFEFVDPNSDASAPYYDQRLPSGITGAGQIVQVEENHFRQTESLGIDELYDTYTLRAYDAWEKTRFESCEIAVQPVD